MVRKKSLWSELQRELERRQRAALARDAKSGRYSGNWPATKSRQTAALHGLTLSSGSVQQPERYVQIVAVEALPALVHLSRAGDRPQAQDARLIGR
jgi:hypothetical protein